MKFSINRDAIKRAIAIVAPFSQSNSPRPELKCVLVDADKPSGIITFRCSRGSGGAEYRVNAADITESGRALFSIAEVLPVVTKEDRGLIEFSSSDSILTVSCESRRYKFFLYYVDKFDDAKVRMDDVDQNGFTCSALSFMQLHRIMHTVTSGAQQSRYSTPATYFALANKSLDIVATDGVSLLHLAKGHLSPRLASKNFSMLFPDDDMGRLSDSLSAMKQPEAVLHFGTSDVEAVVVRSENFCAWCSLLQGSFPPWRDVYDMAAVKIAVEVPLDKLIRGVRKASIMTGRGPESGVSIRISRDGLETSAWGEEGEGSSVFDCTYKGKAFTCRYDPRRLVKTLAAIQETGAASVVLNFADHERAHTKPIIIASTDWHYVLMPAAPVEKPTNIKERQEAFVGG